MQRDESDLHLLTRLAKEHDALASVKGDALMFLRQGTAQTASGTALPAITISANVVSSWRMGRARRDHVGSVKVEWRVDAGQIKALILGSGNPMKTLRHRFSSESEARVAATAKLAQNWRRPHAQNKRSP